MDTNSLLASIDAELAKLREARNLLAGQDRPTKKRIMNADARARIAAAQKKRWAAWKKAKKAT